MINCREQLYRDLNRLLDDDDTSKPVISYAITVVTVDKPCKIDKPFIGHTIMCAGGETKTCKKSIEQLLDTIENGGK